MVVTAFVPIIGTAVVWFPVGVSQLILGDVVGGAVIMFCGMFVIGTLDNVVRPFVVEGATRIPSELILISTLGGVLTFGASGIVIGPVIAALFLAVWELYSEGPEEDSAQ